MAELTTTDLILKVLSKYKLCSKCLGKLYHDIGYIDDEEKGESIKIVLYMEAHKHIQEGNYNYGVELLKILFENSNFYPAYLSLKELNINVEKKEFLCDLCTGKVDLSNLKEEVE
jgi:tRNA U54 and U55 pseudouridine synthase Pus10